MSHTDFIAAPRLGCNLIAIRHPQVRHPVQCRASHQQLRRLPGKRARTDSLAEDRFHAKDRRFSQRPPMVAALALPLATSEATTRAQVLITGVPVGFRVAVLPDACSLARRDGRACPPLTQGVITVARVVGSISRDLTHLALNLREQVGQQLRVLERVGRHRRRHDLSGRLVHAEVKFAPRPALRVSVLAHLPLALAIHLDAGRVHHQMPRPRLLARRQLNLQSAAAARERRVTGHAQLHAEQSDDGGHQSFGSPQRQMVNLCQSRHTKDERGGVSVWPTAPTRALRLTPRPKHVFADPQRQASTPDKRFVIVRPVADAVLAFAFLFGHA